MSDRRADKPPERVAGEPDCHEGEQHPAEWLVRDCVERALLICQLASVSEGELERENADDSVDQGSGNKAGARQQLECRRLNEALAGGLG
jgi:hypothetical protein